MAFERANFLLNESKYSLNEWIYLLNDKNIYWMNWNMNWTIKIFFERIEMFIEWLEIWIEWKKYRLNGCEFLLNGLVRRYIADYQWVIYLLGWNGGRLMILMGLTSPPSPLQVERGDAKMLAKGCWAKAIRPHPQPLYKGEGA